MQYLNPYELLEIAPNADENSIKKAKRRKLAELELNDDHLTLGKHKIYKSDFLKLSEELEDPHRAHYHAEVFGMESLRHFLAEGRLDFFKEKKAHSLWSNGRFVDFISPYFAERYGEELAKALKAKDWKKLEVLCQGRLLLNAQDQERAFQAALQQWRVEHEEWQENLELINEAENDYPRGILDDIARDIEQKGWIKALNLLPQAGQAARDEAAQTLRSFSVAIFNNLDDLPRAKAFALLAKSLNTQGIAKQRIEEAATQLEEIEQKRKEAARLHGALKEYIQLIVMVESLESEIDEGFAQSDDSLYAQLENIEIQVHHLKSISIQDKEHQHVIDKAALHLRSLAITLFNELDEGLRALAVLTWGKSLKPSFTAMLRLDQDEQGIREHIDRGYRELNEFLNTLLEVVEKPALGRSLNYGSLRAMLKEAISPELCVKLSKMLTSAQKVTALNLLIRISKKMDESTARSIWEIGRSIANGDCVAEVKTLERLYLKFEEDKKIKAEEDKRRAEQQRKADEEKRKHDELLRKSKEEERAREQKRLEQEQRRVEEQKKAEAERRQVEEKKQLEQKRQAEEKRRADEEKRKRELAQANNSQPQATNDYMSPAQEAALKNVFRIIFWLIVVLIIISYLDKK